MLMTPQKSFVFLVEIKNLVINHIDEARKGKVTLCPFYYKALVQITHRPVSEGEVEWELPCILYAELSPRCVLISHVPAKRQ